MGKLKTTAKTTAKKKASTPAKKKAMKSSWFAMTASDSESGGHEPEEVYEQTLAAHKALVEVEGDGTLATVLCMDDTGAAKAVVIAGAEALMAAHMDRVRFYGSLGEHVDGNEVLAKERDEFEEQCKVMTVERDNALARVDGLVNSADNNTHAKKVVKEIVDGLNLKPTDHVSRAVKELKKEYRNVVALMKVEAADAASLKASNEESLKANRNFAAYHKKMEGEIEVLKAAAATATQVPDGALLLTAEQRVSLAKTVARHGGAASSMNGPRLVELVEAMKASLVETGGRIIDEVENAAVARSKSLSAALTDMRAFGDITIPVNGGELTIHGADIVKHLESAKGDHDALETWLRREVATGLSDRHELKIVREDVHRLTRQIEATKTSESVVDTARNLRASSLLEWTSVDDEGGDGGWMRLKPAEVFGVIPSGTDWIWHQTTWYRPFAVEYQLRADASSVISIAQGIRGDAKLGIVEILMENPHSSGSSRVTIADAVGGRLLQIQCHLGLPEYEVSSDKETFDSLTERAESLAEKNEIISGLSIKDEEGNTRRVSGVDLKQTFLRLQTAADIAAGHMMA